MSRPPNIGIIAIETYIPTTYVSQSDLEVYYKESKGKYTIGLGQYEMSCIGDREDINSISATVLLSLLSKNQVPPSAIGRLEIGTETIQDKSKSTKTFLMKYFEGNYNIEGITSYNACYGAVQALFNTVAWIESSSWDGRLGVVIAADIAVYESGPARPTGGVGAVALLIGPHAKLVVNSQRSTFMDHEFDFYKPVPSSEYPVVDGNLSINCYLKAISNCFKQLKNKHSALSIQGLADFYCFHAPYYKMIRRAFSKIFLDELVETTLRNNQKNNTFSENSDLKDKKVFDEVNKLSENDWKSRCEKASVLGRKVGNIYCGSLFLSLGQKVAMFAYGSGFASSMFLLEASVNIPKNTEVLHDLSSRIKLSPEEYTRRMNTREQDYPKKGYSPSDDLSELRSGTVYLERVDEKWRRTYNRINPKPKI